MNNMNNSVFTSGTVSSPLSQQSQQIHGPMPGQMGYHLSGGVGYSSPPGEYSGVPP